MIRHFIGKSCDNDMWKVGAHKESIYRAESEEDLTKIGILVSTHSYVMKFSLPNEAIEATSRRGTKLRVVPLIQSSNNIKIDKQNPSATFFIFLNVGVHPIASFFL